MQVNRESPVPMWHQIELALAGDIRAGTLPPGARLPAEAEIAARFGVHRHTARRALAILAEKGAVRIRRGLGTFVEDALIAYPISERTRFTANLQQQNRLASHDLLEAMDQPAPAFVAEALGIAPATPVTTLQTLGRADGVPISVGSNYLAPPHASPGWWPRIASCASCGRSPRCWSGSGSPITCANRPGSSRDLWKTATGERGVVSAAPVLFTLSVLFLTTVICLAMWTAISWAYTSKFDGQISTISSFPFKAPRPNRRLQGKAQRAPEEARARIATLEMRFRTNHGRTKRLLSAL